jgi:carbonic anhydrase
MDPRLNDLLEWLDIKPADADVIRNVGTAATDDVVRSLMFSIHVLGVQEIMIIGHTGCGMEMFTEETFEDHLHTECGVFAVSPDRGGGGHSASVQSARLPGRLFAIGA